MNSYLDTNKSIMISAPAGSGKTEKLARRYIALIQEGIDVERILAITFTDKAAAEMKRRILKILKEEDTKLFSSLLEKMPMMRVSTMHSFCGTLLRQFSFEASIDPDYSVEDAIDSAMTWEETIYQVLMDAGKGLHGHKLLLATLSEKGFRGLDYLRRSMDYLFYKRPFSLEASIAPHTSALSEAFIEELRSWPGVKESIESYEDYFTQKAPLNTSFLEKLFLTDKMTPRKRPLTTLKTIPAHQEWASRMYAFWKDRSLASHAKRTERIREIFMTCIEKYSGRKRFRGVLDFSDLEYLAYKMLIDNPEWANILYAFDEKTDHILVDEFQDTNKFQWEIINKLSEEWRSGVGAKREEGIRPTIFFVGDEKQSIYYFRGANVEIFSGAKEKMIEWLGNEFLYEEAKENYRSSTSIVAFVNHVFSRIMQGGEDRPSWITKYSDFHACKKNASDTGNVEVIIIRDDTESTVRAKQEEAVILARRIKCLVSSSLRRDRSHRQQTPYHYADIAILLRKRSHLKTYEEALRDNGIPFVAVKGIGFYQEAEVAMLRALVFFLSNPDDDYSLYILLKSPLFQFDDSNIIELIHCNGDTLYNKLHTISAADESGIQDKSRHVLSLLQEWLSTLFFIPLSELIEHVLVSTEAWQYYYEPQRQANVKKFIRIVEELEAQGKSIMKIRDFLERTCNRSEEPKANVNTEGMNAVKIMTIHAAKGLEFPVVIVPGLEEQFFHSSGDSIIYEKDGLCYFKSEPESAIRRGDEDFLLHRAKEEEEQKRLFYVALTRAEESLFLIGRWNSKPDSFFGFLRHALAIRHYEGAFTSDAAIPDLTLFTEEEINTLYEQANHKTSPSPALHRLEFVPLTPLKHPAWKGVTESEDIRLKGGRDWLVLGDVFHRIFECISKGTLGEANILAKAEIMLSQKGVASQDRMKKMSLIEREIEELKKKAIWHDIIMPREDALAELPFVMETDDIVYTGRIDRIIKDGDTYNLYDYKTFPVKESEIEYLLEAYSHQLTIYRKAVIQLFNITDVKTFIIFTHTGEIREAGQ